MQWVFVLGHMRSGSSLLVHLLNASDEILGYGETHLDYVGRGSLVELHDHVWGEFKKHGETPPGSHRYVMDKILWPHVHDATLLHHPPLKIIVIVRAPRETLPSILSLDLDGIQASEDALQYYSKSLARTERNLQAYDASFVLVRYVDLTNRVEQALQTMSSYLELGKPLEPEYDRMWSTGKEGIGDPSETIKTGTIVSRQTDYERTVEKGILSKARTQYQQFLSFCNESEHCRSLLDDSAG